ncbi:MAG: NAD(P)H-binding protein [Actinomycetota bacterium]|nr:NAD(P)H-binding protein [Actinomycetota bacterium]
MTDLLVTGASGFIGSRVAQALTERGYNVRAMTRRPEDYRGAGSPVAGDVQDVQSLKRALVGARAAYYLVHSLERQDFEQRDAAAARNFATAAADAGVERIVYLGGLGREDETLSAHLRSRRQVEQLLGSAGVPVTVLRAAVVIGNGGISWEITRQLVAHLPIMLGPRWVNTRVQPIAVSDVVGYLLDVLELPGGATRVFEIGGPDVLRYVDMLKVVARLQNRRLLPVVTVPLLTPRLSSAWLALVTDVDLSTARNLIDSMTNEVVVHDNTIRGLIAREPLRFEDAVRVALLERAAAGAKS